ncbi:MAG TPA: alpha/beta hydrolase [Anaerolineales bacterium]
MDLGGSGPSLVFLHANGYPPACYKPLLDFLARNFHVSAILQRPLWPNSAPDNLNSWHVLSDDLLDFLDELRFDRVVAVGHSLGAVVALRAALTAPDRFGALILIDPVLKGIPAILACRILRLLGLSVQAQPQVRSALRRRRDFADDCTAFDGYRRQDVFRGISDAGLRTMIAGMTVATTQGSRKLIYSPEWEARIYATAVCNDLDLWWRISRLSVPTLIVRGAASRTFTHATYCAVHAINHRIRLQTIPNSSHLVPLECPRSVSETALAFLASPVPTLTEPPLEEGAAANSREVARQKEKHE